MHLLCTKERQARAKKSCYFPPRSYNPPTLAAIPPLFSSSTTIPLPLQLFHLLYCHPLPLLSLFSYFPKPSYFSTLQLSQISYIPNPATIPNQLLSQPNYFSIQQLFQINYFLKKTTFQPSNYPKSTTFSRKLLFNPATITNQPLSNSATFELSDSTLKGRIRSLGEPVRVSRI